MDAATNSYDQFVLDERINPPSPPKEDFRDLIRYPELCYEQRLLFDSSKAHCVDSQGQDDQPKVGSAEMGGHTLISAIDPKSLCMKLGGVYSSKEPRFYISEHGGKPTPVWIDSKVPVDWCRCDVKGLLEFTLNLHLTLKRANIWPEYQSKTLEEMDGMVISTTGPLGPEIVYPSVHDKKPTVREVGDDTLFRLLINEGALADTVATRPQTPAVPTGPPTPEDEYSTDIAGEVSGYTSSVESHQSSIERGPPALSNLGEDATRTQDTPDNDNLGRLDIRDDDEGHDERKHTNLPVLLEQGSQAVAGMSVVVGISIEIPKLTSEEISQALESGNWMDVLVRFPKAQRPLTIVGQGAVKEYLDANTSIRLKPGKIDQDLKRMEKEAKEAAKGTKSRATKKSRTAVTTTVMPSTSEKESDLTRIEKRKRNRTLPPPDLTLRTAKGVVVPETITVCRAQVNMVGGKWVISRDNSCSMAIRASQEYRRHFVERHLGGQRPTKEESPGVTLRSSPDEGDPPLLEGDRPQSVAENNAAKSVPTAESTSYPIEYSENIASDRIIGKGKGKRKREDPNAAYEPTKRVKKALELQLQKGNSSSEAVVSLQDPSTEGSSQTVIGDPSAELGIE